METIDVLETVVLAASLRGRTRWLGRLPEPVPWERLALLLLLVR